MLVALVILALPVTYFACLISALLHRPGWGMSILLVAGSLAAAILGAYAGVLSVGSIWPGTNVYDRTGNNIAAIVTCGPLAGLLALGLILAGAKLRRRH